jgi:hypothetical protein
VFRLSTANALAMTGNGAEVPCKLRKITKLKNIGTTIWYNNYDILTDTIRFE